MPQSIIIDCGASSHFTPDRNSLTNYQELTALPIRAADGRTFPALGCGDMQIHFPMGNSKKPTLITLKDVYYSPHLAFTLVSCTRMTRVGFKVLLEGSECKVYSPTYKVIGVIPNRRFKELAIYTDRQRGNQPNLDHRVSPPHGSHQS